MQQHFGLFCQMLLFQYQLIWLLSCNFQNKMAYFMFHHLVTLIPVLHDFPKRKDKQCDRCLYFFNIRPFVTMNMSKQGLTFCQIISKLSKSCPRLLKCCPLGEISPNLVTLNTCLVWEDFSFRFAEKLSHYIFQLNQASYRSNYHHFLFTDRQSVCSFLNGPFPASFLLVSILYKQFLQNKKCRLQGDSNLGRHSTRRPR